jgi:hypothetical protein
MVDEGIVRICSKLLSKAEADGLPNDGSVSISAAFMQNTAKAVEEKLKAPDIVEPRAGNTIKDSIANLEINDAVLKELRQKFESIDGTEHKFPHPYFGDLSAQEWLVLRGGHEMRHIRQIVRMINA